MAFIDEVIGSGRLVMKGVSALVWADILDGSRVSLRLSSHLSMMGLGFPFLMDNFFGLGLRFGLRPEWMARVFIRARVSL